MPSTDYGAVFSRILRIERWNKLSPVESSYQYGHLLRFPSKVKTAVKKKTAATNPSACGGKVSGGVQRDEGRPGIR
jgi:hypothetical protein